MSKLLGKGGEPKDIPDNDEGIQPPKPKRPSKYHLSEELEDKLNSVLSRDLQYKDFWKPLTPAS